MSISVFIDFQFNKTPTFNPVSIIDSLLEFGWSYDEGQISYLPLGDDNDSFDWQWEEISHWPKVKKIITQQCANKERIGICLVWRTSLTGGQFLFETKESQLLVNLTITRKRIKGLERATDFTWYLEKLLPPLENLNEKLNIQILEINCVELRY